MRYLIEYEFDARHAVTGETFGGHVARMPINAVSRGHALDKAIIKIHAIPEFIEFHKRGFCMSAEARIIE